jgi:hypothetical protein
MGMKLGLSHYRVFQNRVLRISEPKWDEIIGGWKGVYNEELHNLYFWPNINIIKLKRMR